MRPLAAAVALSALMFAAACATTGAAKCTDCSKAQSVVESVAKLHPDCLRLTVHCAMEGGAKACASTDAERVGTASAKEDLDAMRSGKTIVLDEAGAIDVTVPINAKDGKFQSTCGATMKVAGMSRDQTVAQATAIAKAVEAGLGGSCACCCK